MKFALMMFMTFAKKSLSLTVRVLLRSYKGNTYQEVKNGIVFAEMQMLPDGVKMGIRGCSPYYSKYGFYVPKSYGEVFSKWNGVKSDRYMSIDVYYNYAIPALNRYDFINSTTDKGVYSILFPDVQKPQTIIKNRNGVFFDGGDNVVSRDEALRICAGLPNDRQFIIKPTVATACGRGIGLLSHGEDGGGGGQFDEYGKDFIIQEKLPQHETMAALNESSLNTLRLYTYRDLEKEVHFVDECAIVRVGGKGSIKDNVSAGGGFCALGVNGEVSDRFLREKSFEVRSLAEVSGVKNAVIPNYVGAKAFVCSLHDRLPYFDWIGWDVAINPDGDPVFIEFNVVPFIEGPQMAHGPIFGKYLDEVMERIKGCETRYFVKSETFFENGFRRFDGIVTY